MKLKNVNIVERYIEKLILALGLLFGVIVLFFYVLGTPYSVQVDGRTRTADEIEQDVVSAANRLNDRIRPGSRSELSDVTIPEYTEEFRVRLSRPLLPVDRFELVLGNPGLAADLVTSEGEAPVRRLPYFVVEPPAPSNLRSVSGFGVLSEPANPELVSAFVRMIGDQRPRDFTWVSISADFDARQWRQFLTQAPPNPAEAQRIPENWWRNKILVTDVVLQRQLRDDETGEWGPVQTLDHVPGNESVPFIQNAQLSFRTPPERWAPPEADAALRLARFERQRLSRPPFPPLAEGVWVPPGVDPQFMGPGAYEQFLKLTEEIKAIQARIIRLRDPGAAPASGDDATGAGGMPTGVAPVAPGPGGRTPPGARPGGAGVTRRPPTAPAVPAAAATDMPADADLATLESLLRRKEYEAQELLGIREPQVLAEIGGAATPIDPNAAETDPVIDTVRIWQHDLGVSPGQTVRYRMMVSVWNPLFFQRNLIVEQRQGFFNRVNLTSAVSEWTEPIQVLSEHHFFLASSNATTRTATVEVYTVFNGRWHVEEFSVRPGDPIGKTVKLAAGSAERQVNMDVGALVVDIDFTTQSREGMGSRTTRMIYLDSKTGTLAERLLEDDRTDAKRLELRSKAQQRAEAGRP